ncbi:techylectin-5A [Drosophila guanche]|uniref:Blast:Techylectin-5B n=2 Tax=Drosophila guanche TaxID=7266 RepID=A0A3B0JVT4_DROGU|nr:techylectin-5A [Drosophila guanche]SPP84542.1 blast:Techylectin-5B [Drosophila guanche]
MMMSLVFLLGLSCTFYSGSTMLTAKSEPSIRQLLEKQQLKLTHLEFTLRHVLIKVLFLTDADVHAPRRLPPDPVLELSQRMNQLLQRLESEERAADILSRIEAKINASECEETTSNETLVDHKAKALANVTEQHEEKELPKLDPMQPAKADCYELEDATRRDGVYKFLVPELNEVGRDFNERFCAFTLDGPAWTVIQSRGPYQQQENFNRTWDEYRTGFGSLERDFWFGNEFIHKIVYRDDHMLRIELEDQDGARDWGEYAVFRLDSESYNYQLVIDGYQGSMPDALEYHNKMDFSTCDRRNDQSPRENVPCAVRFGSGWWFDRCQECNLNGIYPGSGGSGIIWADWRSGNYTLKTARMMIRPVRFAPATAEDTYDE